MYMCRYSNKCGGCRYMGKKYSDSLKDKQNMVDRLIKTFCPVLPVIGMETPYFYRNKVHAVVGGNKKGDIFAGIYEPGSHKIVPINKCLIDNEKADEIINSITGLMKSFRYTPYNEDTGTGLIRHILIRTAEATGQIMVTIVAAQKILPSKNNFVKALIKAHPEITTIVLNFNSRKTTKVLGNEEEVLLKNGYITDILCGKKFRISSQSFYQVNHRQTGILYKTAIDYAGLTGKEEVLDAYCGIGTIGICASDMALSVTGVELNKAAVKDADFNAKLNGTSNIKFVAGDSGEFIERAAASHKKYNVVFTDPPRSGCTVKFIESVCKMQPDRIVYISCSPASLARDLKIFAGKGYKAIKCQPVDMFAWTEHVETVCLLSNRKPDSYVHLNLKMEDYYRIKDAQKEQDKK